MFRLLRAVTFAFAFCGFLVSILMDGAWAARDNSARATLPPFDPKEISITEKLGASVDYRNLKFRNEKNEEVLLSQYFRADKPVLVALVYYNCPSLCNLVLNGLLDSLKSQSWVPGKEFEVVTISIHTGETAELAASKKANYISELGKPEAASGWHFLVSPDDQVRKLADQLGFGYRKDPKTQEFAHSAALFILTPEAKISRYLYGVEYNPNQMRLALLEAAGGKIGTVIDRILMFCYRYDPNTRKYSVVLTRVMQVATLLTTVLVFLYLFWFWRKQQRT
ncbi:MAG: SCO family protein [Bdellovibrionales bacterium]|nr:SCO family protein [Bdellovibrionales bacterium]